MSLPFTPDEIIVNDLTVNNQANFRKNVYVGLDLTVVNTIRSEGTLAVNKLTSLTGDDGVFNITSDLCVAETKAILCNKIVPKGYQESIHDHITMLNRFGLGRIWLNAGTFPIPANTTPSENPATPLPPNVNQIIPFDGSYSGAFSYPDMLLNVGNWKAPALSDITVCPFNCLWVEVKAMVTINIDGGDIGDRILLDLRKNGAGGDIVARAVHTIKSVCGPSADCEVTMNLNDLVKCNPGDTLDLFIWGHDINTFAGPPVLNAWVVGGTEYHTHSGFKVADLEFFLI